MTEKKKIPYPKDLLARLIGVPAIALLTLLTPSESDDISLSLPARLFIAFTITACVWEGNRFLVVYFRNLFPSVAETWKRILWQFSVSIALSALFMAISCEVLTQLVDCTWSSPTMLISNMLVGLMITFITSIIYECVYFFTRWREAIVEAEELKRQQMHWQLETLKTQVNPHFLFNSLNTLTTLIEEQPPQAVDFVQQLSQVYRYILAGRDRQTVRLSEELTFIKSYIFLLKMRFGENFHVHITIPESLHNTQIPPLVLQLLIENAIKHNIVSREKPLQVEIKTTDILELVVENQRSPKKTVEASSGFGLDNIVSRYKLLSSQEVKIDSYDAVFRVTLPLLHN
jgi:two-component system, LytTR family, sensor kinase